MTFEVEISKCVFFPIWHRKDEEQKEKKKLRLYALDFSQSVYFRIIINLLSGIFPQYIKGTIFESCHLSHN